MKNTYNQLLKAAVTCDSEADLGSMNVNRRACTFETKAHQWLPLTRMAPQMNVYWFKLPTRLVRR